MNIKLKAAREQSGKTQAQVAKGVNISLAQYQNIEYGKNKPSVTTAIQISKLLGVSVESIWDGNPIEKDTSRIV